MRIYNKDRTKRVIVGPRGMYIAQHYAGGAGRNRGVVSGVKVEHYDPWQPIRRPTDNLLLAKEQAEITS